CLMLSFGSTTFGALTALIPGHADLFFRRFLMGAQLTSIYLAGLGAAEAVQQGTRLAAAVVRWLTARRLGWLAWAPVTIMATAAAAYLVPAWRYLDTYDAANARYIGIQQHAQASQASALAEVAAIIARHGPGRAYAGALGNGGQYFRVGYVP